MIDFGTRTELLALPRCICGREATHGADIDPVSIDVTAENASPMAWRWASNPAASLAVARTDAETVAARAD